MPSSVRTTTPNSSVREFHHCVSALLREDDRVLLVHRGPLCEWAPGTWDLPGGHVLDGELETEAEALIREAREELGIDIRPVDLTPVGRLSGPDFEVVFFHVALWAGIPYNAAPEEHTALEWVEASEVTHRTLADRDVLPIIDKVLGR